ncbi:hypothetical protein GCM10010981_39440 [Dyella nitratireducens]|uniref:Uncharacterized protein n=1 Tax=Dyella nitratireducens TaxID=1849580 RepID=A0ABQ1GMH3_9GAMM|nr:hypothetical protein GCM10010981_39440 [Dyella nitratireducens]GLQ41446.1 hypothetical protein GCM10007902_12960 [Dyella nitratireducens]
MAAVLAGAGAGAGLVAGADAVEGFAGALPLGLLLGLLLQPPKAKPIQATAIASVVRFMRFLLT